VQRAYEAFKNNDVRVITISIDQGGANDVKPFLKRYGYTMPALLDRRMEEFSKLRLVGTPGTFIVNREGKIVAKGLGPIDFDRAEFRAYVQGLGGGNRA